MNRAVNDLTGKKFGRLTVLSRHPENDADNKAQWVCRCECGNTCVAIGNKMSKGAKKSCGCLLREIRRRSARSMAPMRRSPAPVNIDEDL